MKLTDEQEKNEELRQENRRLRDAVRSRNRRIKQLTGKSDYNESKDNNTTPQPQNDGYIITNGANEDIASQSAPLIMPNGMRRIGSRNSFSSIGTDDTLPPETKTIGDWMIGLGNSLKAKKCNWF